MLSGWDYFACLPRAGVALIFFVRHQISVVSVAEASPGRDGFKSFFLTGLFALIPVGLHCVFQLEAARESFGNLKLSLMTSSLTGKRIEEPYSVDNV